MNTDFAELSLVELQRERRRLQQHLTRVAVAIEEIAAQENTDGLPAMKALKKRLELHLRAIDEEHEDRRIAVRERVEAQRDAQEQVVDARVAKALKRGERNVLERRDDMVREARSKGDAYLQRLSRARQAIAAAHEDAVAESEDRMKKNDARLKQVRELQQRTIAMNAEERRKKVEERMSRAERNRELKEQSQREAIARRESAASRSSNTSAMAQALESHRIATATQLATSEQRQRLKSSKTILEPVFAAKDQTAFARLTRPIKRPSRNELDERDRKHTECFEATASDAALDRRKRNEQRDSRFDAGYDRVLQRRTEFSDDTVQKGRERDRRILLLQAEQRDMVAQLAHERQHQRNVVAARAQSSLGFDAADRKRAKATAVIAAVCSDLLQPEHSSPSTGLARAPRGFEDRRE